MNKYTHNKSMVLTHFLFRPFFILSVTILAGCSVYKSPDRKDFDSLVVAQNFANLKVTGCANESIRVFATEAKLISADSSLWVYKINDEYFIESDNSEGAYCLYENI